ncbi:uncharacterized protein PGTG_11061 [Puccinia graminis f. sp. tritici CRL 75-36-700-3]|uniref:Uncharacterized protein n=1 Tax=Puccinia graminis f. sp. tritici (strain CRL 75-36-700-3 / race SCCL) TaxID=418459 RepID=E3KN96_PUCGT|nr:uncharacterized protein PGTG_11061 [Puccinia graminis f. sp. tritici CRL 75-36-700-3]EFP85732.2 hypothetical protein PGTG_11061 [Puccinia graminis f. sp. tritici CRL 75-36-700-3]
MRDISEKSLSSHEIDAGKALLVEVQTRSLPILQLQLRGLMRSLATGPLNEEESESDRKITNALEFALQLGATLNLIDRSLASLASAPISEELGFTCKIDHEYGVLKRYKCIDLVQKFDRLLSREFANLLGLYFSLIELYHSNIHFPIPAFLSNLDLEVPRLQGQIIKNTTEAWRSIDAIIRSSKGSDFSFLQQSWREDNTRLNICLCDLSESTLELENDRSQENVLLNLDLMHRIQRAKPLALLGEEFLDKLMDTYYAKTSFTLSPSIVKSFTGSGPANEDDLHAEMQKILVWSKELSRHFDSCMTLFAFFLIPDPSRIDPPFPEDLLRSSFFELRSQLHLALEQLLAADRKLETLVD